MRGIGANKNQLIPFKVFHRIADYSFAGPFYDPGKLAFVMKMKFTGETGLFDFPDKENIFRGNECRNRFHIAENCCCKLTVKRGGLFAIGTTFYQDHANLSLILISIL
jgi:hypothetical protein